MKILIPALIATLLAASAAVAQENENRPLRPLPEDIVANMIVNYDADENNSLDKTELANALKGMRKLHREHRARVRERHEQSQQETRPHRKPQKHVENQISRFDKNNDHELNTEELLSMIDHMHKRRIHSKPPPVDSIN